MRPVALGVWKKMQSYVSRARASLNRWAEENLSGGKIWSIPISTKDAKKYIGLHPVPILWHAGFIAFVGAAVPLATYSVTHDSGDLYRIPINLVCGALLGAVFGVATAKDYYENGQFARDINTLAELHLGKN
jgi:hypothetical protein